MKSRLKNSERNLFIVTLFMAFTIVINSIVRVCFLLPSIAKGIYIDYLIMAQFLTIDFCNVCVAPMTVVWNLAISKCFLIEVLGGLTITYDNTVNWAILALFMVILSVITLIILVATTTVTSIGLVSMKPRLKNSERNLFIVTLFMAFTIVINSIVRACFIIKSIAHGIYIDYLLIAQFLTIDFCNVCTPIVMIYMSDPLRMVLLEFQTPRTALVPSPQSVASIRSKQ
ncbi:unnamed protein product [Caenorhabditis auriculariae]|uniref:Serpentine receptor class gamma n=1 Tax=Caenorhabditis auriculariae TaxID=2777116 RepID=A0A8S1HXE6_9PELO|nr:unnamed protein product [Caenorhabditis auriculariae]